MRVRNIFSLCFLLVAAALLAFFKVPLASSQGTTILAAQVSGELPADDPDAALWQSATAMEIPLSAQTVTRPFLAETRVKSVTVRAIHNGTQIAFLVEWSDETKNDQTVRVQDFRDSVALQFPLVQGQPFFCMGMQGGNVNIWHWKADWQADILAWQDMEAAYPDMNVDQYPFASGEHPAPADYQDINYVPALAAGNLFAAVRASPVEDLMAGGFGTLTAQPAEDQNVAGSGVWQDGKWRVIFTRAMDTQEADDVVFSPGMVASVAFAAWDGANGERNGEKSTSQWVSLQLEGKASAAAQTSTAPSGLNRDRIMLVLISVLLLLIVAGAVIYIRLPN